MLTEENIFRLSLEVSVKEESDWPKIKEAVDKIKIGDIEKDFSLPVKFEELISKVPRKVLSFKYYSILLSPTTAGIRSRLVETFAIPPPEEKEIKKTEMLQEMQANFNLIFGVFLGARSKAVDILEVDWGIRFKVPLKEHFVQNTTNASFLERLKAYDAASNFVVTQIMIVQELPKDEKFTYEILEKSEENSYYIEIEKKFKSPPTTIDMLKLVRGSIKMGDEIINLVRG